MTFLYLVSVLGIAERLYFYSNVDLSKNTSLETFFIYENVVRITKLLFDVNYVFQNTSS